MIVILSLQDSIHSLISREPKYLKQAIRFSFNIYQFNSYFSFFFLTNQAGRWQNREKMCGFGFTLQYNMSRGY